MQQTPSTADLTMVRNGASQAIQAANRTPALPES